VRCPGAAMRSRWLLEGWKGRIIIIIIIIIIITRPFQKKRETTENRNARIVTVLSWLF
jgi:hypothetical protein